MLYVWHAVRAAGEHVNMSVALLGVGVLLAFLTTGGDSRQPWTPQCGTVSCPKTVDLSPTARPGNIYNIDGRLYRANSNFVIRRHHDLVARQSENRLQLDVDASLWEPVDQRTLAGARTLAPDLRLRRGDVIYDANNRKYYRAVIDHVIGRLSRDIGLRELDNVTSDWMTSLRPIIGNKRLSDIVIPGTHDSGTVGMGRNSVLVNRTFFYDVGEIVLPEVLVNWSRAQTGGLGAQLEAGFRTLDLRIADMGKVDGTFRWWHGVTADVIDEGLRQISDFAAGHPHEIVILCFQSFAAPGNTHHSTRPIPTSRKDQLAALLLQHLGPNLAPKSRLPDNPTMNQVLATGANMIAMMPDDYIRAKDDRFWPDVVTSEWTAMSNPEDLFNDRSVTLQRFRRVHSNHITALSGCVTPDVETIIAGLVRVFGVSSESKDALRVLAPNIFHINPDEMSFEGLFVDLLSTARKGTNTAGMRARPANLYSSGGSVHYGATPSEQVAFWIARPQLFKLNTIYVDDFVSAGELVQTAIRANRGDIGRQVSVAFQGNPLDGYYTWVGLDAVGGRDSQNCSTNIARYRLTSNKFLIDNSWKDLAPKTALYVEEGVHPPDTKLEIQVSSNGTGTWFGIYFGDVQQMIGSNEDLYLRGTDLGHGNGFAYISKRYNLFGARSRCDVAPDSGYLALTRWK